MVIFLERHLTRPFRFARVSSNVADFNTRNKILTAEVLKQETPKNVLKILSTPLLPVIKSNVGFKSLLKQGLPESECDGDYSV